MTRWTRWPRQNRIGQSVNYNYSEATALIPLASAGFDFHIDTTDGQGHAAGQASYVNTTAGMGGMGLPWSFSAGSVWESNIAGKAICTTLGAATATAWVDAGNANVRVEAAVTRSGGGVGVLVRYIDASNYAYATNTNTNIRVHQVIAGTPTTLYDAAGSIVAGAVIAIEVTGNAWTLFYNDAQITTGTFNAALAGGTKHGLWTNNTANVADDFLVYNLSTYPAGTAVDTSIAGVTIGTSPDATSALKLLGIVTQHSLVNGTATDQSRVSSDPLWGSSFDAAVIHTRHFKFADPMSGQASGATEGDRVTNTIAGENFTWTLHDSVMQFLADQGITEVVLNAWGFPEWMLDVATGADSVNRTFLESLRAEAAAFIGAFIQRYNVDGQITGIRVFMVNYPHEWKGYSDTDQARLVADYNAIYAQVVALDATVLMAGPYRVPRGNSSVLFGQADAVETRPAIVSNDLDLIEYVLANATATDVASVDLKLWVFAAPVLTYDESVQLLGVWERYIKQFRAAAGVGALPVYVAEGYGFNINSWANFTLAQQGVLHAAMLWAYVRYGIDYFAQWIVEAPSGEERYAYWSSTNDNTTVDVTTTSAHTAHMMIKNFFGDGVALYPATVTGDAAGLLVLASASELMLINMRGSARTVNHGAINYALDAYGLLVITL